MELRPYMVVVAESLEYLVEEILSRLSFKKRPRVKSPRQEFGSGCRPESVRDDETADSDEAPEDDGWSASSSGGQPSAVPAPGDVAPVPVGTAQYEIVVR